jgi:hypothetical protein
MLSRGLFRACRDWPEAWPRARLAWPDERLNVWGWRVNRRSRAQELCTQTPSTFWRAQDLGQSAGNAVRGAWLEPDVLHKPVSTWNCLGSFGQKPPDVCPERVRKG